MDTQIWNIATPNALIVEMCVCDQKDYQNNLSMFSKSITDPSSQIVILLQKYTEYKLWLVVE